MSTRGSAGWFSPTVICIGATGMLGHALCQVMAARDWDVHEFSSKDIDISDPDHVAMALSNIEADHVVVVNAAAFTHVDRCEEETELAFKVNGDGPGYLADVCRDNGWRLVHFSTDYVFNGQGDAPFLESHPTQPLNVYGHSKLAGEQAVLERCSDHLIFRVQWLYGPNGAHFVDTMLRLSSERSRIEVVDDQIGGPSYTMHVADAVCSALEQGAPSGIYHLANLGYTSWFGLCLEMQTILGLDVTFQPVSSDRFLRPAQRPHNSRMDVAKYLQLNAGLLPFWQDALKEFLNEYYD